jgi:hypothetical protein
MFILWKFFQKLYLICVLLSPFVTTAEEVPVLSISPMQSSDGKATINWSQPDGALIDIQKSRDKAFVVKTNLYRGQDNATVVTGLGNGEYHFRGRFVYPDKQSSPWSNPVKLSVEHHSLTRALSFFALGALVFIATLLLIFVGARRHGAET